MAIGLAGAHQVQNASLAIKLAQIFLQQKEDTVERDRDPLSKEFVLGLENTRWPGRCQVVEDPKHPRTTWFLDGAHTHESLDYCFQWFVSPGLGLSNKATEYVLRFRWIYCSLTWLSQPTAAGAHLQLHKREVWICVLEHCARQNHIPAQVISTCGITGRLLRRGHLLH